MTLTATSSSPMPTAEPDEEWGRVLEGVKKDSAYITITADEVIKVIGRDIFAARKPNKKREAMVMARRAMRQVARKLYVSTRHKNCFSLRTFER